MKLRLKDNSIRIRLSMPEVDQLIQSGEISSQTMFPSLRALKTLIRVRELDQAEISIINNVIEAGLPKSQLAGWHENDQVGYSWQISLDNGEQLVFTIEKDFKCLTDRPGEDETSLFPNPSESHG
ncbi:MAG: hypothetical protein KDC80_02310 [Saprospiraceae bacterium]|nr:hypothetical protein [Saprospiraceae bacterium]